MGLKRAGVNTYLVHDEGGGILTTTDVSNFEKALQEFGNENPNIKGAINIRRADPLNSANVLLKTGTLQVGGPLTKLSESGDRVVSPVKNMNIGLCVLASIPYIVRHVILNLQPGTSIVSTPPFVLTDHHPELALGRRRGQISENRRRRRGSMDRSRPS